MSLTGSEGSEQRISVASGEDHKTHLVENFAQAPLKAFGPYPDPRGLKMRLVQIGEGILQGDHYKNTFNVGKNATLVVDTDAYAKIYKSPKRPASQKMTFTIASGGILYFLPDPVIPYADSEFSQVVTVELEKGAKAVFWDILTPGRVGYGECFQYNRYLNETRVLLNDLGDRLPLVWDRQCFEPKKMDLRQPPFFSDFTHIGNLWIVTAGENVNFPSADWIEKVKQSLQEQNIIPEPYETPFADEGRTPDTVIPFPQKRHIYGGMSELTCGILIRVLGRTAEDIVNFFETCVNKLYQGEQDNK